MKDNCTAFDIAFQGVEYIVEVRKLKNDTTVYIEYANIDEDIKESELLKLTSYLIREGFLPGYNEEK